MLLKCFLYLLYMLQLVVLSGLVAAFLYGISNPQSPSPPTAEIELSTAPDGEAMLENERAKHSNVKLRMKVKPITLTYLRENLAKVSSRADLVRLFTSSDKDDSHRKRWISRTLRSVTHSRSHALHLTHGRHKTKSGATSPPDKYTVGTVKERKETMRSNLMTMDTSSAMERSSVDIMEDVVDVKEVDAGDNEDYVDYPQDEPTEEDLEVFEAALHHIEEMSTCSSSRCHDPTPFVLNVRDAHDRTRMFIPECIVLHRCMNYTGCCGGGNHECVPKSMSIVSKAFLVVDLLSADEDYVAFHPNMATTISFVNHTECECREKPKVPKCTKTCPHPFRLTQEGTNCVCDCFSQASVDIWPCESVREGVVSLSSHGHMCIKNGTCYIPRCTEGEFDIKTGYCPLSDEYSLPAFMFHHPHERRFYREHLRSFDFSHSDSKMTSSKDSAISPTPSTFGRNLAKLKDHQFSLERLTSRSVPVQSTTVPASEELVDSFRERIEASLHSTQTVHNFSEQAISGSSESDAIASPVSEGHPSISNKSVHELQSSTAQLYDDAKEIDDNADVDEDNYSDEVSSSEDFLESQRELDTSSQIEESKATESFQSIDHERMVKSAGFSSKTSRFPATNSEGQLSADVFKDTSAKLSLGDQDDMDTSSRNADEFSHKISSNKNEFRDDLGRRDALRSSWKRIFHSAHVDEHHSDDVFREEHTSSPESYSGQTFMKPLTAVSPKAFSLHSSTSSPSSSSLEIISSSVLKSAPTFPPKEQKGKSEMTLSHEQEHLVTSVEKSFLDRLYNDPAALDGSGEDDS